jgi:hypothetical protein
LLTINNGFFSILVDAKNYTSSVRTKEITKLKDDMENTDTVCGAIISTAAVTGFNNYDIHFYTNTAGNLRVIGILGNLKDVTPIRMLVYFLEVIHQKMIETPIDAHDAYREEIKGQFSVLLSEINKIKELETQFEPVIKTIHSQLEGFRTSLHTRIQNLVASISQSQNEKDEPMFTCDICSIGFTSSRGLSIHNGAKHKH